MDYHHTLRDGTELIGEYRIVRVLGSGGFANTYLALDLSLQRDVAIKEYFPGEIAYREGATTVRVKSSTYESNFKWGLERFVREARTLAKFRHQNIVRVFRIFDANNTAYIVLDFVKGADMEVWLKGLRRQPTQKELDSLAEPLLNALDLVHAAGILHRDIKPQNIYIRDEDGVPVLLDFGAARFSVGELTGTTAAIVSRGYSPHEAYATDAKLQGPWTDIYGLSATFYRALFGEPPPEATSRVLDDTIVLATKLPQASSYRREFLDAINWGLSVLPKNRPQTAAAWRERLLASSPTPQPDTTAPPSMPRMPFFGTKTVPEPTAVPSKPSIPSRGARSESRKPASATVLGEPGAAPKRRSGGLIVGSVMTLAGLATLGLWQAGMLSDFVKKDGADRMAAWTPPAAEPPGQKAIDPATERASREAAEREAKADADRRAAADAARRDQADAYRRSVEDAEKGAKEAEERRSREDMERQAEADRQAKRAEEERQAEAERQAKKVEEEQRAEAERKKKEQEERQAMVTPEPRTESPPAASPDANNAVPDGGLDSSQREAFIRNIQGLLKERRCYDGAVNGESSDAERAIGALNTALEKSGREARPILIASASANQFETWLDWLRSDLERFACEPEAEEKEPKKPKVTPGRQREPSPPPRRPKQSTTSAPKLKPATKPSGASPQNPFKPSR